MCLLIISDYVDALEPKQVQDVSLALHKCIARARMGGRPVGFVQRRRGAGFEALNVRIGRYEPVFAASDMAATLPPALIDFVVARMPSHIELAGVAQAQTFARYESVFRGAGYHVRIDHAATLPILIPAHKSA